MSSSGTSDIVTGTSRILYPTMTESQELRWGLIRKVYAILTVQLLLTVVVGALVDKFYLLDDYDWWIGLIWLIIPFISKLFVLMYSLNHLLFAIFTVSLALATGLACSFTHVEVVLEAVILTAVVIVSLTLFTFWAAKRGYDFNILGPFLFATIMVLIVFAVIQIFFPLDRISVMIYECLAAIIFCGYIVYDTGNLIKGYTYDEYKWSALELTIRCEC
ncbi:BI1-like protein [Tanacetum coccineum]